MGRHAALLPASHKERKRPSEAAAFSRRPAPAIVAATGRRRCCGKPHKEAARDAIDAEIRVTGRRPVTAKNTRRSCLTFLRSEHHHGLIALPSQFPSAVHPGVYTMRQRSSSRFLDAHEIASRDFAVVTRRIRRTTRKSGSSPRSGESDTLQQSSNGRFVDAHESGHDFGVVTRDAQGKRRSAGFSVISAMAPSASGSKAAAASSTRMKTRPRILRSSRERLRTTPRSAGS